jgi:HAD superfamily hydrolase (TIGR01484 family)
MYKYSNNLGSLSEQDYTYLTHIRLVATDMDGTLTKQGKLASPMLQVLEELAANNIKVLIVTGRSAGWVSGLSSLMPVVGAIAENGGLFYLSGNPKPVLLTPISELDSHRQQLAAAFEKLQQKFPQIQESADNPFRLTDWTFDVASLTADELETLGHLSQQMGWEFTYSTVQCHIKPPGQDKARGLLQVLNAYFPGYTVSDVVTVGDSPNDESLFAPHYFPISVGVANVMEYVNRLQYSPAYVTRGAEADGFCELARVILDWGLVGLGNKIED